jgi:hypothetical protein
VNTDGQIDEAKVKAGIVKLADQAMNDSDRMKRMGAMFALGRIEEVDPQFKAFISGALIEAAGAPERE